MEKQLPGNDPQVVSLVKQFMIPPSPLPYNLMKDPTYLSPSKTTSLLPKIKKLFSDQRDGFFVEAGATDGQRWSNTFWLEQNRNWSGLLVEPDPTNFDMLKANHRNSWSSGTCLSKENYPMQITLVSLRLPIKKNNSSSSSISAASYDADIKMAARSIRYAKIFKHHKQSYSKAYCFPLISYLMALNVLEIDFLSLDTQGTELGILRTLPWDNISVRVVIAEASVAKNGKEMEKFMVEKGFKVLSRGNDYWFAKEGDPVISRW